jgi:hypothetical protein
VAIPIINSEIETESWTADEMKAVERCDDLLRKRGMQMALICENCFYNGKPPKVVGDNKRSSSAFTLTCGCKRRIYRPPMS